MTLLYRSMKDDGAGVPSCGASSRELGVRLEGDIPITENGMVEPETGGMSVALDDPINLPAHRRPEKFGGYGRDPVWQIDHEDLPIGLRLRPDPRNQSGHGFVEPIQRMRLKDYQDALATTRGFWSQT